ncbi:multidrug ABC transporter substrate-binding protein [Methylobacterium sp. Leaf469]|jgi:lipoprotein-releasing system permease protein|uniref:lipoprotein-releasing ABC transporter permease subunit n=1 Tax=unclassified Methylobacterium TaxID=2615210 RepID=UPI0006F9B7FF|nr:MULTISPECIES: lipoprotein-releasing ABC transporter permease subunit [unclassified Methylobacterium]KQO69623.1 multidrug ABC transporter substrate-binding protein [Methylobacterium sp. Leaf87]KQP34344.1 multidrug ABC transporter substrate-binding protein [Methylobacterium sp. Leaf102]KQP36740.1 multidrug ABC transporter substrate-binding protein [Methylobacterium sp. Leaf100]KQP72300.1 multidrug ABC transporter substrate-binding protein [Methylobacterium sp. Leaf112]KQU05423.1 multidrug ABC
MAAALMDRLKGAGALFRRGSTPPFAGFEWILAGRYLRARRRGGGVSVVAFFSVLGIALGVATLIIVLSVMNGFRTELLSKIVGINGHVFVTPIDRLFTDFEDLSDRLAKVAGVRAAIPLVEGQAFASSPYGGSGVLVRGIRADDLDKIGSIAKNIRGGTLAGFEDGTGVAIGRRLAEALGLQAGDNITLSTPKGATTPFGTAPRTKSYVVKAIFEIGMTEFDATFVFMPLAESQAFFNRDNDVSLIEVYLDNADGVAAMRPDLEMAAERPVLLTDWRQRNRTFFGALEVERNVMFLILSLIVVVATLNIVSGLILLVRDKSSDIAILRTMGATPGTVMRVFLINGALIGVVGTLSGLGLGILITLNIKPIQRVLFPSAWDPTVRFLAEIPAEMNSSEITVVVVTSIVLSLVATLYPSWRAARLDPVQALRYG